MDSSPALVRFAITSSGFTTSMSWSVWMSPAVTGPGPFLCRRSSALSRECMRSATVFRFSRMSTTSSCTPSILVYSWSTPSISTSVMALPGIDDSSTRRSALPSVWPKPRSNGSITTRAWRGATGCTFTTRGLRNSLTDPCIAVSPCRLTGTGANGKLGPLTWVRQAPVASGRDYFEYSSTTRFSLMSGRTSSRPGADLNRPRNSLSFTSTHSGRPTC